MAYDIGPKVGIEGMAEFKKNLREIDAGLKVNASEMRKVTAEYDANDKSAEALTARGQVLEKQLQSQKSKVDELKKVVEASAKATGESSTQTMNWQTKLNDAEAEVIKINKAVQANAAELGNAAKETEKFGDKQDETLGKTTGLGDALGGLTSKLGINLPQGATQSLNSLGGLDAGMMLAVGNAAALAAAVYKIIDALADMTIQSAQWADDILTQSTVTSIAVGTLQEMAYATELVDVSLDTMTSGMSRLIRSMSSARRGTKESADAFAQLGINITDSSGNLRDSEDVFWETIDALGGMANETERDAIAMTLMGKSARDLNPLISAGSAGMAGFAAEAHNVGYVLSEEALATLGDLDDAMQRLDKSTDATKNKIAVEFAPALTGLMETGTNLFSAIGEAAEESGIVDVLTSMLEIVDALSPAAEVLFDLLGPFIGSILKPMAFMLALIADILTLITSSIALIIEGVKYLTGSGSLEKLNKYANSIVGILEGDGATYKFLETQIARESKKINIGLNAAGTDYWRGGPTWVGEQGPEIAWLPTGTQIFSAPESRQIAGDTYNGGNTYNSYTIYPDARQWGELMALLKDAKSARQERRAR